MKQLASIGLFAVVVAAIAAFSDSGVLLNFVMMSLYAALLAQGYRTSTSKPGHHQTTLQCLAHTLGVDPAVIRVLDGLRKQRNLSDYDGEPVTQGLLQACLEQAQQLLVLAHAKWPDACTNG